MLVISRKIGESFVIGDDIEVVVIDITGEKVLLGIAAPETVKITRAELLGDAQPDSPFSGVINQHGYGRKH